MVMGEGAKIGRMSLSHGRRESICAAQKSIGEGKGMTSLRLARC